MPAILLLSAGLGWILAQLLKVAFSGSWSRFLSKGGMPSAHAALVSALGMAVWLEEGVLSTLFAIAFVLAAVVVVDAVHTKRHTPWQAAVGVLIGLLSAIALRAVF